MPLIITHKYYCFGQKRSQRLHSGEMGLGLMKWNRWYYPGISLHLALKSAHFSTDFIDCNLGGFSSSGYPNFITDFFCKFHARPKTKEVRTPSDSTWFCRWLWSSLDSHRFWSDEQYYWVTHMRSTGGSQAALANLLHEIAVVRDNLLTLPGCFTRDHNRWHYL